MNTPPIPVAAPRLDADDIASAVRVLESGHLVQGPEVAAFEGEFAELVDGRHCIAVNSGTSALWLTLLALGIGPGDEVIVPSFTFAATAAAVRLTGATPVFADIAPDTYCLDPDAVRAAITPRTAAVIPVHLFGHPAAMDELTKLAHAAPSRSRRGRRAGPRRHTRRTTDRRLRNRGLLQLLSDEEHAVDRGRLDHHRRPIPGPHAATAAQPGHGTALPPQNRRHQCPDERCQRRHRPQPAPCGSRP